MHDPKGSRVSAAPCDRLPYIRDVVDQIERVRDRLPDVGVGVAGKAAAPAIDGVQRLADGGKITAIDDALDSNSCSLAPEASAAATTMVMVV